MKKLFLFCFLLSALTTRAQKINWIPFKWEGDTIEGRYFAKLAILVPVKVDDLPYAFNMQLDLGAIQTVFYGNPIQNYLNAHPALKNKRDTTLSFYMQNQKSYKLRDVNLHLGKVSFNHINVGLFEKFGQSIPVDSINTPSEKHVGTIAPDLFQGKILIIDYPHQRFCVTDVLPKAYAKAAFQPYKIKDGRIKIPFTMNGETKDLLFDTGSSLFPLLTTEDNAQHLASSAPVTDSIKTSSWGEHYFVYGKKTQVTIRLGLKALPVTRVYFDRKHQFDNFYKEENIWGITGNAYFFNNVVIIDYQNNRFGVY